MSSTRNTAAHVVIGANYGDEGKGLMTDALAASSVGRVVVVRANGGAQAGHTVTLPDGTRHVFHHIGSGALAGADTFLSRHFAVHPMLFRSELAAVAEIARTSVSSAAAGVVFVDPRAPVTTPYDMMLNQFAEEARGDGRHGSCGLGFGETLERHGHDAFALTAGDVIAACSHAAAVPGSCQAPATTREDLRRRLALIRAVWVPRRLQALGVVPTPAQQELLANDRVLDRYLDDCMDFALNVMLATPGMLVGPAFDAIVFEGAQGLRLDQDGADFPHVTRSHTGLVNVVDVAAEAGLQQLDVTYVTRCYLTRHGAGPLPGELAIKPWATIEDATNIPNAWQGTLRFAWLDPERLAAEIAGDLARAQDLQPGIEIRHGLAVTCLDQAPPEVPLHRSQGNDLVARDDLPQVLAREVGAEWLYTARGPSRAQVRQVPVREPGNVPVP